MGPHLGNGFSLLLLLLLLLLYTFRRPVDHSSYSLPGLWAYAFVSPLGATVVCLLADLPALQSPEKQQVINIKFCAENRVEQQEPFSQRDSV